MSIYERPVVAYSLRDLPLVIKDLDRKYGTPDIKNPKKTNGEYALRMILKYLTKHKGSTCKEIAEDEFDRNLSSPRKLKSITDDIRKFINNNLIVPEIVYPDEPKKKYNKQVETYSLSPIGILYSMYLLGNFRITDDLGMPGYDLLKIDRNLIKNLGKEYSETLPKVFGKFEIFEKIFGKDFTSFIITPLLAIFESERGDIPRNEYLLTDYVLTSYQYSYAPHFKTLMDVHKFIAEQISLIFYVHFEDGLIYPLQDKIDEDSNFKNKNVTARYREALNQARQKWTQIMDEDKELKKWYLAFLKNATRAKKEEYRGVSQYHKEVFRQWNFPS